MEWSPEAQAIADELRTGSLLAKVMSFHRNKPQPSGFSQFDAQMTTLLKLFPTYARSLVSSIEYGRLSVISSVLAATATPAKTFSAGASRTESPENHVTITPRAILPQETTKQMAGHRPLPIVSKYSTTAFWEELDDFVDLPIPTSKASDDKLSSILDQAPFEARSLFCQWGEAEERVVSNGNKTGAPKIRPTHRRCNIPRPSFVSKHKRQDTGLYISEGTETSDDLELESLIFAEVCRGVILSRAHI